MKEFGEISWMVLSSWFSFCSVVCKNKIGRANSLAVSFKVISCFKRHYMRDWEQCGMVGWAEAKGLISHVSIDLL
jgi:hypothetical protein